MCVRYGGGDPFSWQAGRGTAGLRMGGVDHHRACCPALRRQGIEDAVAEGFVRAVFGRRVTLSRPVADDVDDTRNDAPVVDPGDVPDLVG